MHIPVIIPAYEPDERLIVLLEELYHCGIEKVVLVDDGSGEQYQHLFHQAQEKYHCHVLKHAENLGKGRALKNAFNYLLNEEDILGCVTADSDGQHGAEDIKRCMDALEKEPQKLVLGCRNFDLPDIPPKSRFGNKITHNVCKILCGMDISDTQTGLRAIPRDYMRYLLNISGERFEFETNMLVESKGKVEIAEVEIETIYDSKENHKTHFNPMRDSIRIYKIFGKEFLKFMFSSFSASLIDLSLFSVFCALLRGVNSLWYITVSTILARAISATYNYLMNYKFVFRNSKKCMLSVFKYFALAVLQMGLSAVLVTGGVRAIVFVPEVTVKVVVDVLLYFINYKVQQKYVFN